MNATPPPLHTVPIPDVLLSNVTLRVWAELFRRGAARDDTAWVSITVEELSRAINYSPQSVTHGIRQLAVAGCLLAVWPRHNGPRRREGIPMFHLSTVAPANAIVKEA